MVCCCRGNEATVAKSCFLTATSAAAAGLVRCHKAIDLSCSTWRRPRESKNLPLHTNQRRDVFFRKHPMPRSRSPITLYLLGPFHIQNQVIISKARHSCNGPGGILSAVKADKGKALKGSDKVVKKRGTPFCLQLVQNLPGLEQSKSFPHHALISSSPLTQIINCFPSPWIGQWFCPWPSRFGIWTQTGGRVPEDQSLGCPLISW